MPETMTAAELDRYRREGCIFPIDILSPAEAETYRQAFEETERAAWGVAGRAHDDAEGREWLRRPHQLHRWAYELCTHPRLVAMAADILGPDVLLWDAKLWPKPPGSRSFVSWHQDGTYVGLRPLDKVLTIWLALTDAGPHNGGMSFVPGSHLGGQVSHHKTFADANLLSRGQVVDLDIDSQPTTAIVLRPGQASAHHMYLLHGSGANPSTRPRLGISINYVTPEVIETGDDPRPAVVVRGSDPHGHFASFAVPT